MPIDSKECFTSLTEDGQLWEIYQAASTGGGGSPTLATAGGQQPGALKQVIEAVRAVLKG